MWLVLRTNVVEDRVSVLFKSDNPLVDASFLEQVATVGGIQLDYLHVADLATGYVIGLFIQSDPGCFRPLDP